MKFYGIGFPMSKTKSISKGPKLVVLTAITLVILTLIPIYYPLPGYLTIPWISSSSHKSLPAAPLSVVEHDDSQVVASEKQCDLFTGEWVPNPQAPYYTNLTCWAIHEHQNCMKYGRPDSDFMKWRWKPDECDLPIFNPYQFLEIVRGKSMAFVGDSVARNQMQSLMCLLSRVMYPVDVSYTKEDGFKRWHYTSYNYTLATFLTSYLVRAEQSEAKGPTGSGLFNLYLDEYNEDWRTQIEPFDYVIISAGHWFQRPMMFYEKGQLVGCHYCLKENVTDLNMFYGYRKAFRTAFKAIRSLPNYKGITYLRTIAPSHFEKGVWNEGGDCVRIKPFRSNESHLEGRELEYYRIQLEEFRIAEKEGKKIGQKYRLLDTTQPTYLRPDGHPSRYGHWPNENVTLYNDCVHWCLPGPIDAWNDFLLHMMKMEYHQRSQASQQ